MSNSLDWHKQAEQYMAEMDMARLRGDRAAEIAACLRAAECEVEALPLIGKDKTRTRMIIARSAAELYSRYRELTTAPGRAASEGE